MSAPASPDIISMPIPGGGGSHDHGCRLLEKGQTIPINLMDIVYNCQICGACDISCKYAMDMEVLEPINEIRFKWSKTAIPIPPWIKSSPACESRHDGAGLKQNEATGPKGLI